MWDWPIWTALILAGLAGIAALALLAVRALTTWRLFEETRAAILGGLDEFAARAEAVREKVTAAGDAAELRESVARLRLSLARFAVLRAAIDEAQETFGRVAAIVPRK